MKSNYCRREFVKTSAIAGLGLGLSASALPFPGITKVPEGCRIGMIGLDTSHAIDFTKIINGQSESSEFSEYKIVAAYPTKGSADMESSIGRLDRITNEVKDLGIEIVRSIDELLKKVDLILLESVDGRRHLSEALPVLKAGKRMFIDKPLSNNLAGALAIFEAAKKYNTPVFSCSSMRFTPASVEIAQGGKIGKVIGANTFCPSKHATGHSDFAYYGIHGIESLFTLMGTGCKKVKRIAMNKTDIAIGIWEDERIGMFRSIPNGGKIGFGATVFGSEGIENINTLAGNRPLLKQVIDFFRTGIVPVSEEETLEMFAFMEAADESKLKGGDPVDLQEVMHKARKKAKEIISQTT